MVIVFFLTINGLRNLKSSFLFLERKEIDKTQIETNTNQIKLLTNYLISLGLFFFYKIKKLLITHHILEFQTCQYKSYDMFTNQ